MIKKIITATTAVVFGVFTVSASVAAAEKNDEMLVAQAQTTTKPQAGKPKQQPAQNKSKAATAQKKPTAQKKATAPKKNVPAKKATVKKNTTAQKKKPAVNQKKKTAVNQKKNTAVNQKKNTNTAARKAPVKSAVGQNVGASAPKIITIPKVGSDPKAASAMPTAPGQRSPLVPATAGKNAAVGGAAVGSGLLDAPMSKAEQKYAGLLTQAQFAYEQKDYRQALALMHQAYDYKREPFVAGNIATIYMLTGDAANCVRIVREYKISDPDVIGGLILGLVERGMLYHARNIAEITSVIHDNGSVAYARGVMYERLREPLKAEENYRQAVMMRAHNPSYVYALARINDVLKNYDKAFALYEDVLALTKRGDLYINAVNRLDELRQVLTPVE